MHHLYAMNTLIIISFTQLGFPFRVHERFSPIMTGYCLGKHWFIRNIVIIIIYTQKRIYLFRKEWKCRSGHSSFQNIFWGIDFIFRGGLQYNTQMLVRSIFLFSLLILETKIKSGTTPHVSLILAQKKAFLFGLRLEMIVVVVDTVVVVVAIATPIGHVGKQVRCGRRKVRPSARDGQNGRHVGEENSRGQ